MANDTLFYFGEKKMRTIIAGSRSITTGYNLEVILHKSGYDITEVVSGGALGVDRLGEQWAKDNRVPIRQFIPKWQNSDGSTDKAAGFKRNIEMANYADALVAYWDGKSNGTVHMIKTAIDKRLKVFVVTQ